MTDTPTTPQFNIRTAVMDDLPRCLELDPAITTDYVWQVEAEENGGSRKYNFRPARLPRSTVLHNTYATEKLTEAWQTRTHFVVAEGGATIYGYLGIQHDPLLGIAWVRELVVDRTWRRQGIGSALLNYAQRWAKHNRLQKMMTEAQTKNHPAITFFQSHGLTFAGFNDHYYPNRDIALFFVQNIRQ